MKKRVDGRWIIPICGATFVLGALGYAALHSSLDLGGLAMARTNNALIQTDSVIPPPPPPLRSKIDSAPIRTGIESILKADLDGQLAFVQELKGEAERAPEQVIPTLCEILRNSDGVTETNFIAAVLDVLRSLGSNGRPAAETLSGLLSHRCQLYHNRDKMLVIRLRAYIIVTLSEIGFPRSGVPFLLDSLAHLDERMPVIEIGGAARAVGSLGKAGHPFAPYLIEALSGSISDDQFSLERFGADFPPAEATTVQLEAMRALAQICSGDDRQVQEVLQHIIDQTSHVNQKVRREAQHSLDQIQRKVAPNG